MIINVGGIAGRLWATATSAPCEASACNPRTLRNLAMRTLLAIIFTAFTAGSASAEPMRTPGRFGIGIGSGTLANGLSAKYFLNSNNALQFNLGTFGGRGIEHRWSRYGGFGFSADYLFEMPAIAKAGRTFELAWNLGAGLGVGFDNHDYEHKNHRYHDYTAFAAAFVLGLEFNFIAVPLDIVLEFRPTLLLVPYVAIDPVDFTAHIRFYF